MALSTVLEDIIKDGAQLADNYVTTNSTQLLADAASLETKAVDELVPFVQSIIPSTGIFALIGSELKSIIADGAQRLITAAGGENATLLALLKDELAAIVKNGIK